MVAELLLSATGDLTVDGGTEGTTETSVFSDTVPAGTPGADKLLIARSIADIRNDSGSNQTVIERWKYGGTTLHAFTTISLADSGPTNRYADLGLLFLGGANSASAQRSMFEHRQGGSGSGAGLASGGNDHNTTINTATVDSTSSQTLQLTAQLSAANAELEFRRRGVWVERLDTDDPADGSAGTRLVPGTLDATEVTVVNTVTETSVYAVTIPGGTIGTGNLLIVRLCMDALNNSGTSKQWWPDIYFGGTQIFERTTGVGNATSVSRRAFPIEVWIGGAGSTGSQICALVGDGISGVATSGEGAHPGGSGGQAQNSTNVCSVDSTVDQTFEIKVTMNSASPSTEIRKLVGSVSVVKA